MSSRTRVSLVSRVLVGMVLVLSMAAIAEAGAVRGRLVRRTQGGDVPAQGVPVTVSSADPRVGRSGVSYTGADGMYYLHNIPPGNYTLEIWIYPNQRPLTYAISVGTQPFTDIAPILVP